MFNLVKILSYSSNPLISVPPTGFPELYWCRKSFTENGEKTYPKTALYGCVVNELINALYLDEIEAFFDEAYRHPEYVTIYSHVREEFENIKYLDTSVGMHLSSEFFTKDSKYKTNILFFDMDSIQVDFDTTNMQLCAEFIVSKLNEFNPDIFPKDIGYVIKPSGSSGIKPGIRNHIAFINETKISLPQIKALAVDINKWSQDTYGIQLCDPSIYSDARKIYLSRPKFSNPDLDPYKGDDTPTYLKEGSLAQLPDSFREHIYAPKISIDLEEISKVFNDTKYSSFNVTKDNLDPRISKILDDISSGIIDDNVMNQHIHRVFYLAIQEGYDLNLFCDKFVTPIITKYATTKSKSIEHYTSQLNYCLKNSVTRVSRGIEEDCWLKPIKVNNLPAINGYLDLPSEFPEVDKVNFIKASLGTGKTTTVRNLMKSGKLKNVIAITNRVSLAKSNASKLDISSYGDIVATAQLKNGGLSICINSLSKLMFEQRIKSKQFDTLFIDEADSMMQDLLTASTFSNESIRIAVLENLRFLLLNCKYVILADGDMSSTTIKAYMELMSNVKEPRVFVTEVETHKEVRCIEYTSEKEMSGALLATSELIGQRSLVVTDFSPEKIRSMVRAIELHCEDLGIYDMKIIQIHSDSTSNAEVEKLLRSTDTTKALHELQPDIVITSPTVTSGIDFQGYFNDVFCFTTSNVNEPNIRLQAICRERKPDCIHMYISKSAESSYVDEKIISSAITTGDNSFIGKARLEYIKRALMEREKYRFYMRYNMLKKGVQYSFSETEEFEELWDSVSKQARMEQLKDYVETVMFSNNQFADLNNKNSAREFKKEVQIFSGLEHIDLVTEEHILAHHKSKNGVKAKNLHALVTKVRPLWNELEELRTREQFGSKNKEIKNLFLKYLPTLTVAGVRFDRDYPLQTLKKFGFIVETIVLDNGVKTSGIKTWHLTQAEHNLKKLHEYMGDKYDLPDFVVKQDELLVLEEINEI